MRAIMMLPQVFIMMQVQGFTMIQAQVSYTMLGGIR